jgi:hypothetical protein
MEVFEFCKRRLVLLMGREMFRLAGVVVEIFC